MNIPSVPETADDDDNDNDEDRHGADHRSLTRWPARPGHPRRGVGGGLGIAGGQRQVPLGPIFSQKSLPPNLSQGCEYVAEIQPLGDLLAVQNIWEHTGSAMKKFLIAICSIVLAIGVSGCVGKAPVGKGKAPPPVVKTRG